MTRITIKIILVEIRGRRDSDGCTSSASGSWQFSVSSQIMIRRCSQCNKSLNLTFFVLFFFLCVCVYSHTQKIKNKQEKFNLRQIFIGITFFFVLDSKQQGVIYKVQNISPWKERVLYIVDITEVHILVFVCLFLFLAVH